MSPVEQREYFSRIHNLAMELFETLKDVPPLDFKSFMEPHRMITTEAVRKYLEDVLGVDVEDIEPSKYIKTPQDYLDYCKFWLNELVPHVDSVLLNIALVAAQNINEPLLVKKPNARKAAIHYFIKNLSAAMRHQFGQPLHENVAVIAGVVFNDDSIDSDLVRKLTKNTPNPEVSNA